jgi:hypothetical protein
MSTDTCARCGLPRSAWQGSDGNGYTLDGETYCCQGCAEGAGCTCEVIMPRSDKTGGDAGLTEFRMRN